MSDMQQGIMGAAPQAETQPGGQMQGGPMPGAQLQPADDGGTGEMDADSNEAYQAGLAIVMDGLYGKEGALDVARAMQATKPAQGIADMAYTLIMAADDQTGGEIPDELLIAFAVDVMVEVGEIAEAAGVPVDGAVMSDAFRLMLTRFLKEQGMDTAQIEQAMAQAAPEFGALLDKAAEQEM